jgi:SAM-dependent methyltransferase
VLDAACGEGYGSFMLAHAAAHVTGIDISTDAIAHARTSGLLGVTIGGKVTERREERPRVDPLLRQPLHYRHLIESVGGVEDDRDHPIAVLRPGRLRV